MLTDYNRKTRTSDHQDVLVYVKIKGVGRCMNPFGIALTKTTQFTP